MSDEHFAFVSLILFHVVSVSGNCTLPNFILAGIG